MIAQSFANIVKTNNGAFKSAAQAAYLLSQCEDGQYVSSGTTYGNCYVMFYICDDQGVIRVQKQTVAKGLVTQWERRVEGTVSLQDAKEIKRIKRMIKQTEQSIASREASRAAGEYPSRSLFDEAQGRDHAALVELNTILAKLM